MASNQFPFGIGAVGVFNGGPSNNSDPMAGRFQPMGFQFGHQQGPQQPVAPNVSGAPGFQHGSGAGTQGDNRTSFFNKVIIRTRDFSV